MEARRSYCSFCFIEFTESCNNDCLNVLIETLNKAGYTANKQTLVSGQGQYVDGQGCGWARAVLWVG